MPDTGPDAFGIFMNLFIFLLSLILLFILLFLITPRCTGLTIASGGQLSCEMGEGSYAIGAVLVVLAGYTGYQLCGLLFPARFGSI